MNLPDKTDTGEDYRMGKMDTRTILIFLGIGLLAGFLAFLILPGSGNIIGMLLAGIIGSFVGGFLFGALNIRMNLNPIVTQIITSTVGAIIVIIIARLII